VIKLQILVNGVLGDLTALTNEIEVLLEGRVGERGRIKIDGRIRRLEFRKHFQY
jgi:hypothetical protein